MFCIVASICVPVWSESVVAEGHYYLQTSIKCCHVHIQGTQYNCNYMNLQCTTRCYFSCLLENLYTRGTSAQLIQLISERSTEQALKRILLIFVSEIQLFSLFFSEEKSNLWSIWRGRSERRRSREGYGVYCSVTWWLSFRRNDCPRITAPCFVIKWNSTLYSLLSLFRGVNFVVNVMNSW